jgi:hypothetical protein
LTPRSATVMRAIRAEKLCQIILGPGPLRPRLAGKQPWPVTPSDLPAVLQRRCQRAGRSRVARHRAQESPEATLPRQRVALVLVTKDGGRLMDPAIPHPDVGPYISRVHHAPGKQGLQSPQLLGQGPLFSTRSRLAVIAVRRSWSLRPEASRGGRPSSVRALRTAAQEPRTTAAAGSHRPARRRARGRPPRPRFFRACLAWRSAS